MRPGHPPGLLAGRGLLAGGAAAGILLLSGASECEGTDDCTACVADFAVYDPAWEDDGVWEEEVAALDALLTASGFTWERVDAADLNQGRLGVGADRRYRALIAPGGYASIRDLAVDAAGEAGIRDFVRAGGGYLGFCAGTYWAAETVLWAEEATGGGGAWNLPQDYVAYPYDLALLHGTAQGPLGWTPWAAGTGVSLELAALDLTVETLALIGIPASTRFFYYGGPVFAFDAPPAGLEVWARAVAPEGVPAEGRTGEGAPTIVAWPEGEGEVILFSYHPEILIGSDADGVVLTGAVDEAAVSWDTGGQSWDEIWLQSWNIVHAALQRLAGEAVTPLTAVPGARSGPGR